MEHPAQRTFSGVVIHGDLEASIHLHENGDKIAVSASTEGNKSIHVMMYAHHRVETLQYPVSKHSVDFDEQQIVLSASGIRRYRPTGIVAALWTGEPGSPESDAMHWNCNLDPTMRYNSLSQLGRVDLDLPVAVGEVLYICALRNSRVTIYPKPQGASPTHLWLLAETSVISVSGQAQGWNSRTTPMFITAIKRASVITTQPVEIFRAIFCIYNDSVVDGFHEEEGSPQRSRIYLHSGRMTVPRPFDMSKCDRYRWSQAQRLWTQNLVQSSFFHDSTPWVPLRISLSENGWRATVSTSVEREREEDASMAIALRASEALNHAPAQSADEVAKKRARVEYKDDPPILRLRPKPKNEDDENLKETATDKACVICLNHRRTHWSVGCAHMLYCDVCVHEVVAKEQWKICPTCNTRSRGLTFEPIM
jgi:hypothetical protein